MRDMISDLGFEILLPSASYGADNTPAAVDISDFASAVLAIEVGVGGITFTTGNKVEFKLTHSKDDETYDPVTVDDLLGIDSVGTGGIVLALTAAHAAASVLTFGYRGGRRYLKLLADFSGTHATATPMSALVICGDPHQSPVT